MEIRPARQSDREGVMDLCRTVYPDGDYVEDTWDAWRLDGDAYVMRQDGITVCTFNASVRDGQGWLEGTRVHPGFRRRRIGTVVLEYAEDMVRSRGGRVVRSLIEPGNTASLMRARKAGWRQTGSLVWYGLGPQGTAQFAQTEGRGLAGRYVDSWRVYEYTGEQNTVFFAGSAATIIPSRYFPHTTHVTILDAADPSELAAYLHSVDVSTRRMHGWTSGLHITAGADLPGGWFERISSFCLMSKDVRA